MAGMVLGPGGDQNAMVRPSWNGWGITVGKKSRPVRVATCAADRWFSVGPSSCRIGLKPRKAANSTPIGGRWLIEVAVAVDTPLWVKPCDRAVGRWLDSPMTISEKKIPMDSTNEAFWNVAMVPPAAPRWLAGTEFMISARLGEANRPEPRPLTARMMAKTQ